MTFDNQDSTLEMLAQVLAREDSDPFRNALAALLDGVMLAERQRHLQADLYERSEARRGYANGFKAKTLNTRVGRMELKVPQVRSSEEPFYPSCIERGRRSERALMTTIAEMYVQGVSTRKVQAIMEQLGAMPMSSMQVSRATAQLDEFLEPWRNRPLGQTPYLILDARYEKVRDAGQVRDAAVLIAVGIGTDGKRRILGVSVSLSEQEVHWREFLSGLVERGLAGVELIVSDSHEGLKAARKAVFGSVPWQRCQCHLQRNAQAYVPAHKMKAGVAADIRSVFTAGDRSAAETRMCEVIARYRQSAPKLASWMEDNLHEGLTVFALPEGHRRLLRTTNGLERLNKEIKRRTRVATLFPSDESCLRLVSAVLMEISEEWETGKAYLSFES